MLFKWSNPVVAGKLGMMNLELNLKPWKIISTIFCNFKSISLPMLEEDGKASNNTMNHHFHLAHWQVHLFGKVCFSLNNG